MVSGVLLGSALWWLLLSTAVGVLRERFDQRWQRAINLCSALLLTCFAAWQLATLLA
jgi:arginine exporter protein ArgO